MINITLADLRYSSSSPDRFKSDDLGWELRQMDPRFGPAHDSTGMRPLSRNRDDPSSVSPETQEGTTSSLGYVTQTAYSEFACEILTAGAQANRSNSD